VGEALESVFGGKPQVRFYVLDERGALRKHVCIFADDGERLAHEAALVRRIGPVAAGRRFRLAVAAHPRDPQTAWFVPAIKAACRTMARWSCRERGMAAKLGR
jgi:hypothetical protein